MRRVAADSCYYYCWQFSPLHAATAPTSVSCLTGATHQLAQRREHGNSLCLSSIFTVGSLRWTPPAKLRKTVNRGSISKYSLWRGASRGRGERNRLTQRQKKREPKPSFLFSFTLRKEINHPVPVGFSEAPLGVRAAPARCAGLPLCSVVPLQSVSTSDLGACGESGRPKWWRAQERKKKNNNPLWRPDDSPVWTWPWLPSPSFDRGPPGNRILLLRRRGEERSSFVTVALIAPFPLCPWGPQSSGGASTRSLAMNVGSDLVHVQWGLTHHRWRTPSPDKVSSLSQSPQTASLQEDQERTSAKETGSGNTAAARSHFSCFCLFVFS